MSKGHFPHTAAARVNSGELARIDAAARLAGLQRARWVRGILLEAAAQSLRVAGQEGDSEAGSLSAQHEPAGLGR